MLLVSCSADTELTRRREALQAWDEASAAGTPAERKASLERALERDPASPAIRRALARLLSAQQEHAAAEALLTAIVPPEPREAHTRILWDRAAVRAAAGDVSGAAEDLEACVLLGVDPRALGTDPAFAVMTGLPEYARLLPPLEVRVDESNTADKVLVGEVWSRTVRVQGPPGTLSLEPVGPMPRTLRLERVVEDERMADAYTVVRELRMDWRTEGIGAVHMPAMQARVGDTVGTLAPRGLEVVAVGASSRPPMKRMPGALVVPSAYDATVADGAPVALAGGWLMQAPEHWTCQLRRRPDGSIRIIRRSKGQPRWSGWWVPGGSDAAWSCAEQGISASLR